MYVHIVPSYLNLAFKSKVPSAHCIKSQGVSGININQRFRAQQGEQKICQNQDGKDANP